MSPLLESLLGRQFQLGQLDRAPRQWRATASRSSLGVDFRLTRFVVGQVSASKPSLACSIVSQSQARKMRQLAPSLGEKAEECRVLTWEQRSFGEEAVLQRVVVNGASLAAIIPSQKLVASVALWLSPWEDRWRQPRLMESGGMDRGPTEERIWVR